MWTTTTEKLIEINKKRQEKGGFFKMKLLIIKYKGFLTFTRYGNQQENLRRNDEKVKKEEWWGSTRWIYSSVQLSHIIKWKEKKVIIMVMNAVKIKMIALSSDTSLSLFPQHYLSLFKQISLVPFSMSTHCLFFLFGTVRKNISKIYRIIILHDNMTVFNIDISTLPR